MGPSPLDVAVLAARAALRDRGVPDPGVLILAGTGLDSLPERIAHGDPSGAGSIGLDDVPGMPELWSRQVLFWGHVRSPEGGACCFWMLVDEGLDAPVQAGEAPFERGFPIWLAAFAGARLLLHTSASGILPGADHEAGDLALVRDHLNLSGSTPLMGLGTSKLGPMFPDVSRLHTEGLRSAALDRAAQLGICAREAVVAATAPVSLATPAEREWYHRAGAELWIQGAANPFLAAAHAGLAVLAISAVTGDETPEADLPAMLSASTRAAPDLDALLRDLLPLAAAAALEPSDADC